MNCIQSQRINEIHRIAKDVVVQTNISTSEINRVFGGPTAYGGIVIAETESD